MERYVAEPYEPYSFLEQLPPHPAFTFREELTREERIAVAGYQDMGFIQHKWDVSPPEPAHPNCSVINSFLRFADFREGYEDAPIYRVEADGKYDPNKDYSQDYTRKRKTVSE